MVEDSVRRALVIDDQDEVRAMIAIILRRNGFGVAEASNGVAGVKELTKGHFDVAIVDVYMPGIDGTKTIQVLRMRDEALPIVAISGVMLTDSGRTALDLFGMNPALTGVVCLKKPFRDGELLQAIDTAMTTPHKHAGRRPQWLGS